MSPSPEMARAFRSSISSANLGPFFPISSKNDGNSSQIRRGSFVDFTEFQFDAVLPSSAQQVDVYNSAARHVVLVRFVQWRVLRCLLRSIRNLPLLRFVRYINLMSICSCQQTLWAGAVPLNCSLLWESTVSNLRSIIYLTCLIQEVEQLRGST